MVVLCVGARVELVGLQRRPALNGRTGVVLSLSTADGGRCRVQLEGEEEDLSVRPENLCAPASQTVETPRRPRPTRQFAVHSIPDAGLGIVATCDLTPGTRILAERPLFFISGVDMVSAKAQGPEAQEAMVLEHVVRLSANDQRDFWGLSDCWHEGTAKTAFGIWQTNAIATGEDAAETHNGLFVLGSRFNHSCRPNVNRCWVDDIQAEVFHVVQDVVAGEQLCIYYVNPVEVRSVRQQRLQSAFNFLCSCECCSLEGDAMCFSDSVRQEYKQLDQEMSHATDPALAIDQVLRVLEIVEAEFDGDPHLAQRIFFDGFQFALLANDLEVAGMMATRAHEAKVIAEGVHAKTKELKRYSEDPSSYPFLPRQKVLDESAARELGTCPPPPPPLPGGLEFQRPPRDADVKVRGAGTVASTTVGMTSSGESRFSDGQGRDQVRALGTAGQREITRVIDLESLETMD